MQEDFPCSSQHGSYEMHVEPDIRQLGKVNPLPSIFPTPIANLKEVELPRDQKANIQLNNNIKLSLDVKHILQEGMPQQEFQQTSHNQGCEQNSEGQNNRQMNFSVRSQFQYENDRITSVVVIQIQNQTLKIINDMFLINQLLNSTAITQEGILNEGQLTKQNLANLPDYSGKRNQKQEAHQIRKSSHNSNDSDTTQPLQNNAEQQECSNQIYHCYKCGAQNSPNKINSQNNQKQNLDSPSTDQQQQPYLPSQYSNNKSNINMNDGQLSNIKNQNCQQDIALTDKRESSVMRRVRKGAIEEEFNDFGQSKHQSNKKSQQGSNKNIKIEISVSDQNNTTRTPSCSKRYHKSKLIQKEDLLAQERMKIENNQISKNCELKSQDNQSALQNEMKSFQSRENLISTAQQVQSESYNNRQSDMKNQLEILALKPTSNQTLILPNQYILQDPQNCKEYKSTQSISNPQQTTQRIFSNKNAKGSSIIQQNESTNNNFNIQTINYENIPSFSCTSLLSSPTERQHYAESLQNSQLNELNYQVHQTNSSISNIQLENDHQKENDIYNQQSQDSCGETFQGSCEEEFFTDDFIAKADKKNVVKNFAKAFISYVRKTENILNQLEDQSKNTSYHQKLKKFLNYMKKNKFNNLFIKQLISNSEYSIIFQQFLLNSADDWLINSNVQDKDTHKQMLKFFQKASLNQDLLNRLKTLKKNKRAPNSTSNKVHTSPTEINTANPPNSTNGIRIFSPTNDIDFVKIIDDNFNQLASLPYSANIDDNSNSSSSSLSQQSLDKKNQSQNLNCLQTIQQALNDIQINNPSFLIPSINNNNQS